MTRSPRRLKQQVQDTVGEQVRDLPLHAVRLAMFGVGRALLLSDRVTKDYKEIKEGGGVRPVLDRLREDAQHTAEKVVTGVVTRVRGGEEEQVEVRSTATQVKVATPPRAKAADPEIAVGKPAAQAAPAPSPKPASPSPASAAEPVAKPAPKPSPKPAAQAKPAAPAEPAAKAEPAEKPAAQAKPAPTATPAAQAKPAKPAKPAEEKPAAKAEAKSSAAELPVPDYDEATLPQLRARLRGLSSDQVNLLREYEREHAARAEVLRMYENRIAKLNGGN